MGKFVDLTGQKFGRWTVIRRAEDYISPSGHKVPRWLCKCDCGGENSEVVVISDNLKLGKSKSCGCLISEKARITRQSSRKYNIYDLSNDYGIGYTSSTNKPFFFDLEDYDKIKEYCWRIDNEGYIVSRIDDNNHIFMHRLVMNPPDDMEVDHIYHNKNDNRKELLRIVTPSQNNMNSILRSNNTSGVTGVRWHNRNEKWIAFIGINYENIHLGSYDDFDEAVEARKQAEIKYFGEYRYIENQ